MKILGGRRRNVQQTDDHDVDLPDIDVLSQVDIDLSQHATVPPPTDWQPAVTPVADPLANVGGESAAPDGLSIVVPHADPEETPTVVAQPELDDADVAIPPSNPGGQSGVSGEMIDWFLDPERPVPEQMVVDVRPRPDVGAPHVAEPHGATRGGTGFAMVANGGDRAGASGTIERFERPPLPEGLETLKAVAKVELGDRLGDYLSGGSTSEEELRGIVIEALGDFLSEQDTLEWTDAQLDQLAEELLADVLGHGPIQGLLDDPLVSEIMVNGTSAVFVERGGRLHKTSVRFESNEKVRRVIDLIVSRVGRRIDESSPMVDARLPDGSRVNAIISPLSVDGPMLTIRKFSKNAVTAQDMVAYQTLNWDSVSLLRAGVFGRLNILISGGTGTGKTTLLNVCSGFIPEGERVVTIEDSVELRLNQEHVIRLESRPANLEGSGEVTIRDLVRNSLRMRPDRIVVGECRGAEAIDMLQAMNTGHEGSLSTLHANTPRDALARLETMVLMAGLEIPARAVREQIASAIDMIVHLERMRDGSRRVSYITEVSGMEGDTISLSDIFKLDIVGIDENGVLQTELLPTGVRPLWADKLAAHGIELAPSTFGDISLDSLV